MESLAAPPFDALETFLECVDHVSAPNQALLYADKGLVENAAFKLRHLGTTSGLGSLSESDAIMGNASSGMMTSLYENHLVSPKGAGYSTYAWIKNSAPQDRCPLCSQRTVAGLDHYFPKAKYPALAVDPMNLVPSCSDCNFAKNAKVAASTDMPLHPYFDNLESATWLAGNVVRTDPVSIRFEVVSRSAIDAELFRRVQAHFALYDLEKLYSKQAATEIINISHRLKQLCASGGPRAVAFHLSEEHGTRFRARRNSWQTAMYEALAADTWFHDIGCQQSLY